MIIDVIIYIYKVPSPTVRINGKIIINNYTRIIF